MEKDNNKENRRMQRIILDLEDLSDDVQFESSIEIDKEIKRLKKINIITPSSVTTCSN